MECFKWMTYLIGQANNPPWHGQEFPLVSTGVPGESSRRKCGFGEGLKLALTTSASTSDLYEWPLLIYVIGSTNMVGRIAQKLTGPQTVSLTLRYWYTGSDYWLYSNLLPTCDRPAAYLLPTCAHHSSDTEWRWYTACLNVEGLTV